MKEVTLTSAIAIGGKIKKAGSTIEVDNKLAADLVRRGKAQAYVEAEEGEAEGADAKAPAAKKTAAATKAAATAKSEKAAE